MLHRIGGGSVENLALKPAEAALGVPGLPLLGAYRPGEAASAIRAVFPKARRLHAAAGIIGSTTAEAIRATGFDVIPDPTATFPNHHRLIHPDGAAGFGDANLTRLADAFTNSTGH